MTLPSFSRDDTVAVALAPGVGLGLATDDERWAIPTADPGAVLAELHDAGAPRWVWWGRTAADPIAVAAIPIDRCWDVAVVHRLLHGTWRAPLGVVWATLQGLDLDARGLPTVIRASVHYYNSEDEVDAVVAAVDEVR